MLHRVGGRFAQPLGQLPAVLALASAQQTLHIAQTARSQLRTRKQPCDQAMRPQQLTLPSRPTLLHPTSRRTTLQSNPRLSFIYNYSTSTFWTAIPESCENTHKGNSGVEEKVVRIHSCSATGISTQR